MNTQNTQIHIRAWQRGFWFLVIANFLVAMSVYILVPVMPLWLMQDEGFSARDAGMAMGAFGLGMFTMVSWALITDVIDYAELQNGVRRYFPDYAAVETFFTDIEKLGIFRKNNF